LLGTTPLKAQTTRNARNLKGHEPLAKPMPAGDLVPAGTTMVTSDISHEH